MGKFVFRLQSFLNLKEKLEEQAKIEYGKAMQALQDAEEQKEALLLQKINSLHDMKSKVSSLLKSDKINEYNRFLTRMDLLIEKQKLVVKQLETVAEEKRMELVEAVKERKMLESLKDKDFEEFREEEKQKEQVLVDEVVSFKFSAKNK